MNFIKYFTPYYVTVVGLYVAFSYNSIVGASLIASGLWLIAQNYLHDALIELLTRALGVKGMKDAIQDLEDELQKRGH